MQPFEALGSIVEASWRKTGYDELAFPSIAAEALADARIHEQISPDDVLRELLTTDTLPHPYDLAADYAEPALGVYHGRRFHVQLLFWLTESPGIHDHAFCGAFQVFAGSS